MTNTITSVVNMPSVQIATKDYVASEISGYVPKNDNSSLLSIDSNSRKLYASDGSTEMMDWSTAGLAKFGTNGVKADNFDIQTYDYGGGFYFDVILRKSAFLSGLSYYNVLSLDTIDYGDPYEAYGGLALTNLFFNTGTGDYLSFSSYFDGTASRLEISSVIGNPVAFALNGEIGAILLSGETLFVAGESTLSAGVNIGRISGTAKTGDIWTDDSSSYGGEIWACTGSELNGWRNTRRIPGTLFTQTASQTVANTTTEKTLTTTGIGSLTLVQNWLFGGKTIEIEAEGTIANILVPTLQIKFKLGSTAVVDTTATQAVDVTVKWGTANAANTITCTNLTLKTLS